MYQDLIERLKQDPVNRDKFKKLFRETEVPTKKTLLCEGDISNNIYFIKKGCLRLWFNNDGKDITFQFFFENNAVSSIESFLEKKPGQFNLESILYSAGPVSKYSEIIIPSSKKNFLN